MNPPLTCSSEKYNLDQKPVCQGLCRALDRGIPRTRRVRAASPFLPIDALLPLRYDLFLFFSPQLCAMWNPWGVTKPMRLSEFGGSSGIGSRGQQGRPAGCRPWARVGVLAAGQDHSASSSLQPPPIMKRNSWRFETPWK